LAAGAAALALTVRTDPAAAQARKPKLPEKPMPAMPHVDDALVPIAAGGLTSEQVGKRALSTSYVARANADAYAAAEAKADVAAYDYVPQVTLTASYTRLSPLTPPTTGIGGVQTTAPPGTVNPPITASQPSRFPIFLDNYLLQAALVVPVSDYFLKTNRAYSAATQSAEAARWDLVAANAKVLTDARQVYYEWVRSLGAIHVAEQSLTVAQAHAKDSKVLFDVGAAVAVDVLRAESEVSSAELALEQAKAKRDSVEFALRTVMHAPENEKLEAGESLDDPPAAEATALSTLVSEAVSTRAEMKSIEKSAESARSSASAARAGRIPTVSAFATAQYANPNTRKFPLTDEWFPTWSAGVQLTWSPKDFLVAGANSADADARAAAFEAEKLATRDGLMQEVVDAYTAVRAADLAAKSTSRQLDSAMEAYKIATELYISGTSTGTTLLDAQAALAKARLDRLNARADARIARVKLDHALGRDTRGLRP
jgi:outer membrane protein TolC